jgi:hypothetical protein
MANGWEMLKPAVITGAKVRPGIGDRRASRLEHGTESGLTVI